MRVVLAACAITAPLSLAYAQNPPVGQLAGVWSLTSLVEDHGGKMERPFGDNPNGRIVFDNGAVTVFIATRDRPKSTAHPMPPVGPAIAYYGAYTLEGKNLTDHVLGATYPNFEGTDQKGVVTINSDNLALVRTITGGAETFTSTLELKRVK